MIHTRALARQRYVIQVGVVAALTIAGVFITDALAFRSLANMAWMVGVPVVVGMVANTDWDRRCFMALALLAVSLVVGSLVGVVFVGYP